MFGGCSLVFSVPLMCFPRKLSRRQEIPADRMKKKLVSKKAAPNAFLNEMKRKFILLFTLKEIISQTD